MDIKNKMKRLKKAIKVINDYYLLVENKKIFRNIKRIESSIESHLIDYDSIFPTAFNEILESNTDYVNFYGLKKETQNSILNYTYSEFKI